MAFHRNGMCLASADPLINTLLPLGVKRCLKEPNRFSGFASETSKPLKRLFVVGSALHLAEARC
jgi:hypothetical protein